MTQIRDKESKVMSSAAFFTRSHRTLSAKIASGLASLLARLGKLCSKFFSKTSKYDARPRSSGARSQVGRELYGGTIINRHASLIVALLAPRNGWTS